MVSTQLPISVDKPKYLKAVEDQLDRAITKDLFILTPRKIN